MDLLRCFSSANESPLGTMVPFQGFTDSHVFEAGPSSNTNYHHLNSNADGSDSDLEAEPPTSEESEAIPLSVETTDVDADEPKIEPRFNSTNVSQPANSDLNYSNDPEELKAYAVNDSDDDDDMEIWDENYPARVGLGMYIRNKNDVMLESKLQHKFTNGPPCNWYVYAVKRRNDHMWQIIRWVDSHNYYDTIVGNENRSLKSRDVATRILHNMREDLAYHVKQILAFIKDQLNVDISYSKAWRARKEAIERIYGSWESNFEVLPRYIAALQESNPEAWEYLKGIKESKWTLLKDKNHRRWGNMTTNISESFNNALGGIRLMPIKAIINCTFEKLVGDPPKTIVHELYTTGAYKAQYDVQIDNWNCAPQFIAAECRSTTGTLFWSVDRTEETNIIFWRMERTNICRAAAVEVSGDYRRGLAVTGC
ncbi:hypothetical protein E3N88_36309 [Mikania micrantha]|uniref:Transposase MuDR plant domain-containing protein n=1 Tax=Mikania micrantha TaxID=192012 RepID=A0A5N6M3D8_9ASTR|nr:hypothetical protein E3N88_36309 [Mikania micrantha]